MRYAMEEPPDELDALRKKSRMALACPACGEPCPLIGRRDTMRHPFAQMLEDHSFRITAWWSLIFVCSVLATCFGGFGFPMGRGMGWGLMIVPILPALLIWFVVRLFPVYRVTSCPYCGFKEIEKMVGTRRKSG